MTGKRRAGRLALSEPTLRAGSQDDCHARDAQGDIFDEDRVREGFERVHVRHVRTGTAQGVDVSGVLGGERLRVGIVGVRCAKATSDTRAGFAAKRVAEPVACFGFDGDGIARIKVAGGDVSMAPGTVGDGPKEDSR